MVGLQISDMNAFVMQNRLLKEWRGCTVLE